MRVLTYRFSMITHPRRVNIRRNARMSGCHFIDLFVVSLSARLPSNPFPNLPLRFFNSLYFVCLFICTYIRPHLRLSVSIFVLCARYICKSLYKSGLSSVIILAFPSIDLLVYPSVLFHVMRLVCLSVCLYFCLIYLFTYMFSHWPTYVYARLWEPLPLLMGFSF